jgi:hypothetical protein
MSERRCKLCRDKRWVCEDHPGQPWVTAIARVPVSRARSAMRLAGRTSHQHLRQASGPRWTGSTARVTEAELRRRRQAKIVAGEVMDLCELPGADWPIKLASKQPLRFRHGPSEFVRGMRDKYV